MLEGQENQAANLSQHIQFLIDSSPMPGLQIIIN